MLRFHQLHDALVDLRLRFGRASERRVAAEILIVDRFKRDHVEIVAHAIARDHRAGELRRLLDIVRRAWTQIPLLTFVKNTVKITVVVTLLQLFTSSFAAYAFAKMQFKGKNALFLGYIATIAVPWQAYMVPQFMMMSSWHLNNTHLAIMCLQAFSAFGVFLMKQFYEGVPTELCEAARIDGLSEYGIWWHIMLPLSLPALSTLTIFTFVNTWNDFLGPLIYLTKTELKTIQIGLRMFITQYSAEYGLIMAASVVALIPVLIVFLSLQKYFVQGVASTGIKG